MSTPEVAFELLNKWIEKLSSELEEIVVLAKVLNLDQELVRGEQERITERIAELKMLKELFLSASFEEVESMEYLESEGTMEKA